MKTKRLKKMDWILYAFITMFSLGIMVIIFKKLTMLGLSSVLLNLYIFGLVFLGFLGVSLATKQSFAVSKFVLLLLLIAAVFSIIGNYTNIVAISKAPNPGYAASIGAGRILLITIASVFLFNSDFSILKLFGVIAVLIGFILISV